MLTTDQIAAYEKDMYAVARKGYKEKPLQYPNIYTVVSGVKGGGDKTTDLLDASELDRHTAEDQEIRFDSPVQGWQHFIAYKTFSKGVPFSKNAVEDTVKLGNMIKSYAGTWGRQVRVSKEDWAAKPFNDGGLTDGNVVFNGSWGNETDPQGDKAYDGFPLFNLTGNARATKNGGTYYNAVTTTTLNPDNFETLYNLMTATNNRDERDQIIENEVDTLLTQDGADYFKARRVLLSNQLPGGQLNDINIYKDIVKPMKWSYLSGGAWYVGKSKHPSVQFHERQKPELRFYRHEETRGYRATIDVRFGVVHKDWRAWGRNGGSFAAS